MRTYLPRVCALGLAATLAACAPPATGRTSKPSETLPPGTPILPTPTPRLQAMADGLVLIPGVPPDAWTALGVLTNQSDQAVQDVRLQVSLTDAEGSVRERSDAALAVPLLGPGDSSPFSAPFKTSGTQAEVEVTGYQPAAQSPLSISISLTRRTESGDGRLAVMGTMANQNPSPVRLAGLALVGTAADGRLVGMSTSWRGLTGLAPGQEAPFLALLGSNDGIAHLESYAAALAIDGGPQTAIDLPVRPQLRVDDQGNVLVLGVIHNHGGAPAVARVLVTLDGTHGASSAALYDSPIPLAPAEQRPFTLSDFPGLIAQLASGVQNMSDLRPSALVDPIASHTSSAAATPLEIEITAYEVVGGTLFIHGTAYNQNPTQVLQPTVIGALRSTSGEVWSAGEVSLGGQLSPDAREAFLLAMPRPAGVEPSEGEFDVRGLGLAP